MAQASQEPSNAPSGARRSRTNTVTTAEAGPTTIKATTLSVVEGEGETTPPVAETTPVDAGNAPAVDGQINAIKEYFDTLSIARELRPDYVAQIVGHGIRTLRDLTRSEASSLIKHLAASAQTTAAE